LSLSGIKGWAKKVKETVASLGALVVLHGSGHNAGLFHDDGAFMMKGNELNAMLSKGKGIPPVVGKWSPKLGTVDFWGDELC